VNIFGVGLPEMAVILVLALLVFGPKKLPEIGRSLGKALRGFQEASKDFENEFKREAQQLEQAVKTTPTKSEEVAIAKPESSAASTSQQG
jgi:sec-independent protein translocase protein TatA